MTMLKLLTPPTIVLYLLFSLIGSALRSYGQGLSPRMVAFVADVPFQAPLDEIWLLDIYSGRKHRVLRGSDIGNIAWSPDYRKIAFIQYINNEPYLAVIGVSGSGYHQLIQAPFGTPVWSPDGEWLATSSRTSFGDFVGLYIMRSDGTDIQQISPHGSDPVWSQDGSELYYLDVDPPGYSVNTIDLATFKVEKLHQILFPFLEALSWSPDREWFSYVTRNYGNRSLHLLNIEERSEQIIASDTDPLVIVGWTNNSEKIVYSNSLSSPLIIVSIDDPQVREERDIAYYRQQVIWHEDTSDIIFTAWVDDPARYEIFRMDADDSVHRLTNSVGHKWDITWWNLGQ